MNAQRLYIPLLIIALLAGACKKSKFDSKHFKIKHDGEKRDYLVHTPPGYTDSKSYPLVIGLHGGGGSAKQFEEQSQLSNFADEKGFIACFPDGYSGLVGHTWNAGKCCGKAMEKNSDDVGFIDKMLDQVMQDFNIDPGKVYVTGLSNGAYMSYRLACELSHRIAAIAPVAGSMNLTTCQPGHAVSIIHFHSYKDSNVPYEGGVGDGVSDHYNPPVDSVLNVWAGFNNCNSGQTLTRDKTDYDRYEWTGCDDNNELVLYLTHDGGHSWPGGVKPRKKADEPSQHIDANTLMWQFFQQHGQ